MSRLRVRTGGRRCLDNPNRRQTRFQQTVEPLPETLPEVSVQQKEVLLDFVGRVVTGEEFFRMQEGYEEQAAWERQMREENEGNQ